MRRLALLAQVIGARLVPEDHELSRLGAQALQRACFSAVEDLFARSSSTARLCLSWRTFTGRTPLRSG